MRPASLFVMVALGAGLSAKAAAPTPDQQELIAGCGTMAQAVFEFAQARDKGLSKPDAFTAVTRGKVAYGADAQVTETEDWAFDHADEQPMTVAAHFHGRCVLDAWELLTPISDQQLSNAALTCQQDQAGKPQQIRLCIDRKTATMVADSAMPVPEATAVVVPPPTTRAPKVAMAAIPAGAVLAPVPAPPPQATEVAVAPPSAVQAPQVVAVAGVAGGAAIASVPPPPPEATDLAAEPPAAAEVPEVAVVTPPAGAVIAAVPPPPPEATNLSAEPLAATPVPEVAMVTLPAGTVIDAVSPPVEATDLAADVPTVTPLPEIATASMPAVAEIAAVPAPPPEATDVVATPPPVTQTAEVAMLTTPAAAAIASVSAPPPVAPVIPVTVAAVSTPVAPSAAQPTVALTAVPAPAVATSPASSSGSTQLAVASALPVSLPGIGKLSIGMSMEDAAKAMGHHGDDDTDAEGNPARSFMISDGHAYIELLTESGKPDVVYGIEYHGGADAKLPPILGVNLGDDASAVLSHVGEPTSRNPAPLDRTLWAYEGRNYSFEISSGGDLITVRIVGYDGLNSTPAEANAIPAPTSR
ncbi:MAG TPA: hypothetical protein VGH91_11200 [Gammaproteobacteria bacterium]|jgi:hypothetical protein